MPTPLTPTERRLRAQLAANTRWAQTDRAAASEAARERQLVHFENVVDPNRELHPAERARRADNARRAHMAELSLKSAKARRLRSEADRLDAESQAS